MFYFTDNFSFERNKTRPEKKESQTWAQAVE